MTNISDKKEQNISFSIKNADIIKSSNGNYELNIILAPVEHKAVTKRQIKNLTHREIEVLEYMHKGKTNNQIAKELTVTVHTIKAHVAKILRKLNVANRQQAILIAEKGKIIIPDYKKEVMW